MTRPAASWWSVGADLARLIDDGSAWVPPATREAARVLLDRLRGDVLVALAQHSATPEGRRRDASGQDAAARALGVGRSTIAAALREGWLLETGASEAERE